MKKEVDLKFSLSGLLLHTQLFIHQNNTQELTSHFALRELSKAQSFYWNIVYW